MTSCPFEGEEMTGHDPQKCRPSRRKEKKKKPVVQGKTEQPLDRRAFRDAVG
jgi:hypothetical protein